MKITTNYFYKNIGFTLVEMAIVLVIVGLMVAAFLTPLSAQIDQRRYAETERAMAEIKEAIIGYALVHGHFPCPAKSSIDGTENRDLATCAGGVRVGGLPWSELGVPKLDGWGHQYRYSVTLAYADSVNKVSLSPMTPRDITIQTRDNIGNIQNVSNINDIPVIIMSMGKNGVWGLADDGAQVADNSASNLDEDLNGNGNGRTFRNRTFTVNSAAPGGEIDDIVTWISPSIYLNRMVTAGRLP